MYVLVDKEMPIDKNKIIAEAECYCPDVALKCSSYYHVQGSHVVAQFILEHANTSRVWNNQTLIVLGVSRRQLKSYSKKIIKEDMKFSRFNEPDLDYYTTAIATVANDDQAKIFERLELL